MQMSIFFNLHLENILFPMKKNQKETKSNFPETEANFGNFNWEAIRNDPPSNKGHDAPQKEPKTDKKGLENAVSRLMEAKCRCFGFI